ncbi:hypothetical protein NDU88_004511 [Pleurodeles waltl]|uniref:Uncharacterized protein n=1 Tax=Pleurodeles waltl TaxID=8319 RepID=A0AAV7UGC3_PLEWA|nr:hypothetical protein NDU88_004511 [Pleurodeles waltl]
MFVHRSVSAKKKLAPKATSGALWKWSVGGEMSEQADRFCHKSEALNSAQKTMTNVMKGAQGAMDDGQQNEGSEKGQQPL